MSRFNEREEEVQGELGREDGTASEAIGGWKGVAMWAVCVLTTVATAAAGPAVDAEAAGGKRELVVMTRNLYQGADVARIVAEPNPYLIPLRVAETMAMVVANDFPARARGLASEVAEVNPDVIGLQEATLFQVQSPGDFLWLPPDQQQAATDVAFDYLRLLLDALAEKGLKYEVACVLTNFSMELPMVVPEATGYRFDDVRLSDRLALLVRSDLPEGQLRVTGTASGHFATLMSVAVAGVDVPILRGWCSAKLFSRGRTVTVINAHPEAWHPLVRMAQAAELAAGPAATDGNLVCLGDFNSNANASGWDGYSQLLASGLADVWRTADGESAPPTWGREEDLALDTIPLIERLDLILYRGRLIPTRRGMTGDDAGSRVLSELGEARMLWHSDHAGVHATFRLP
jgi:endonuclease/exonuclease/phosphatase family metal-dependent hydrolase